MGDAEQIGDGPRFSDGSRDGIDFEYRHWQAKESKTVRHDCVCRTLKDGTLINK